MEVTEAVRIVREELIPGCQNCPWCTALVVVLAALEQAQAEVAACDGHGYLRDALMDAQHDHALTMEAEFVDRMRLCRTVADRCNERDALREAIEALTSEPDMLCYPDHGWGKP